MGGQGETSSQGGRDGDVRIARKKARNERGASATGFAGGSRPAVTGIAGLPVTGGRTETRNLHRSQFSDVSNK